jgi:two-component system NtrC family response regulator
MRQHCILIRRVAERRTLVRENEILRQELQIKGVTTDAIQYKSPKMAELIQLAARIAPSQATVLIQGETGTGKELFARLIHHLSPREAKPFVAVNCAVIPESLIESELFGHEKGSFTGAFQRRIGRFEQADSGTLFLDEIGELSPAVQVKLLRFLQEREFQRVGGEKTVTADVRIISATHQDLDARVKDGTFREDLFYRIHVVAIKIPPLKDRREDIPVLMTHFIRRFREANRKKIDGVSREAQDLLVKYDYPGNVRELENIIERAIVIARGSVISTEDLPFQNPECEDGTSKTPVGNLHQAIAAMECEMIEDAMQQADFNQSKAALLLGIGERMLRYKLKKYGLK